MQVVIFPNDENGVSFLIAGPEFVGRLEDIAQKDVPNGKPWRIMEYTELPPRESRDRWRWTDQGPLEVAPENTAT